MNITEAKEKINALLASAENENEWGGAEIDDCLTPGMVDWPELRTKINEILDQL